MVWHRGKSVECQKKTKQESKIDLYVANSEAKKKGNFAKM